MSLRTTSRNHVSLATLSRLGIAADMSAAPAKKGRPAKAQQPYPGDSCRNKDSPCKEQEGDRLCQKTDEKPCANNEPSQGLARQEKQHAVRWLEIFPDLAHRHAALRAAKPWPGHWVGDVLDVHMTANVDVTGSHRKGWPFLLPPAAVVAR